MDAYAAATPLTIYRVRVRAASERAERMLPLCRSACAMRAMMMIAYLIFMPLFADAAIVVARRRAQAMLIGADYTP